MNLTTVLQAPLEPTTNPDPIVRKSLAPEELIAAITAAKGKTFFVWVSVRVQKTDNIADDYIERYIEVTKKIALKFVKSIRPNEIKCSIPVGECSACFFIG